MIAGSRIALCSLIFAAFSAGAGDDASLPDDYCQWTVVDYVPTMEDFKTGKKMNPGKPPFKEIVFQSGGKTSNAFLIWTGQKLRVSARAAAVAPDEKRLKLAVADSLSRIPPEPGKRAPQGWKNPDFPRPGDP